MLIAVVFTVPGKSKNAVMRICLSCSSHKWAVLIFAFLSDFRKNHGQFFQECFKQTVKLALELKLASLGHISLDGSKFKANTSKHKAMSYDRLKKRNKRWRAEIDGLIKAANRCDQEEDKAYFDKTGYEIPEDLKFKQSRLAKIKNG